jgi:hypothetical protein
MGQRPVAARFWALTLALTLAALLLGAAPAIRLGSLDLAPSHFSEQAEVFGSFPFGDGMVLSSDRLFTSESSDGIERSRTLSVAGGVVALYTLLAVGVSWSSSPQGRRRWTPLSLLHRVAGPRAPPLQLA